MSLVKAIMHIYPGTDPWDDFRVKREFVNDEFVESIYMWNLPEPQPTEEELQKAWNAIKDLPEEPQSLSEAERILQLEAENKLLTERAEFIEDLIAEMAMRIYP